MSNAHDYALEMKRYYRVWQETNAAYEEWAKRRGISSYCLNVLLAIDGDETCTQKGISRRWVMPKQTVNMILKDLQAKGYVELVPMQKDRRSKQIRFTPAGRAYADSILSELSRVELAVAGLLGIETIRRLNEDSERYLKLFKELGGLTHDEHEQA